MATARALWTRRELVAQFSRRFVQHRYRGTYLGILWAALTPLLLLGVFTFVFSIILKAKWGAAVTGSRYEFALTMYCGLVVFNFFSEAVAAAPGLILGQPNLVTKVVFPLEILPVAQVTAAAVHTGLSMCILLVGCWFFLDSLSWHTLLLPLTLFPLLLLTLGATWLLSSLGVFIRDIGQSIALFLQLLMFLTPVFYPASIVPKPYSTLLVLNPLTMIVENVRHVLIGGQPPEPASLFSSLVIGMLVFILGHRWFMKSKKAFADVM